MLNATGNFCYDNVVHQIKCASNKSPVQEYFQKEFSPYLNIFPCAKIIVGLCEKRSTLSLPLCPEFSDKTMYDVCYVLELFRLSMDVHGMISTFGSTRRDHACILHGDFLYTQALQALLNIPDALRYLVMECVYKCAYARIQEDFGINGKSPWRWSRKYANLFTFCYTFCMRNTISALREGEHIFERICGLLGRFHASSFCFLQEKIAQDCIVSTEMSKYEESFQKVLSKVSLLSGCHREIRLIQSVYDSTLSDLLYLKKEPL